jgi:hypothetical protein
MEAAFVAVYNSITHREFRTAKSILTQPELAKNKKLQCNISDAFHVVAVSAGLRPMGLIRCSPGWISPLSNLYVARYTHPNLVKYNVYNHFVANKDKVSEKTFTTVVEAYSKGSEEYNKGDESSWTQTNNLIGKLFGYFQPADGDKPMHYTLEAKMILPKYIKVDCGFSWGPQGLYELTPKLIRQAKNMHEQLNHLAHLIYPELSFSVSIIIDPPK